MELPCHFLNEKNMIWKFSDALINIFVFDNL